MEIKFKVREVKVLITEPKFVQTAVLLSKEAEPAKKGISPEGEAAAVPLGQAGEVPGNLRELSKDR